MTGKAGECIIGMAQRPGLSMAPIAGGSRRTRPMIAIDRDARRGALCRGASRSPRRSLPTVILTVVTRPPQRGARGDHGARDVATVRKRAPGRSAVTLARPRRHAMHRASGDLHMPIAPSARCAAHQCDKPITRRDAGRRGARLSRPARTVDLAGRDTGKPDLGPLGAPDRAVAVPDRDRRARERRPRRYDRC